MGNTQLSAAKKAKNDEFYTRMTDIEHELVHYKDHFKGNIVLCDRDDLFESNFFRYFALNFNHLGLKRLIATCYSGSPIAGGEYQPSLFDDDVDTATGRHRRAYKAVCFASMFVRQVRQCFSVVWADGFPRCRHRFPVM